MLSVDQMVLIYPATRQLMTFETITTFELIVRAKSSCQKNVIDCTSTEIEKAI